jgi:hypothetical protein
MLFWTSADAGLHLVTEAALSSMRRADRNRMIAGTNFT